jgi:formate dehydrogenase subunit delta
MKIERLIKMANDISDYFKADPDTHLAIEGIKTHIVNSWEPRMRLAIVQHLQQHNGEGLSELAKLAIQRL